jgi:hypothetical protein
MSGKARSQPLPAKEESLLKQVTKLYEAKQYKKGIKTADQVLSLLSSSVSTGTWSWAGIWRVQTALSQL